MSTWIYKCNASGKNGPDSGDWVGVFEEGWERWGSESLRGMSRVRAGDRLIAVQTDRKELVGVALAIGFRKYRAERHLYLRPTERIGAKIPPLKKEDPRIARIPALQGGVIASIYEISEKDADRLLAAARRAISVKKGPGASSIEELDPDRRFEEGATARIVVNAFERNSAARSACLKHYGTQCFACRTDLELVYGERARGFIHVHHVVPLASVRKTYRVDPVKDMRPLCPNCHAVVHLSDPPLAVDELQRRLQSSRAAG